MEDHKSHRAGWLRAAVLGANDGIVSTASLVIGVAAATTTRNPVFTAGDRRPRRRRDVDGRRRVHLGQLAARRRGGRPRDRGRGARRRTATAELRELAKIYEHRGVEPGLARLVAEQLMAHDELGAHMRDELGITEIATGPPVPGRGHVGGRVHRRRDPPVARGDARADQRPHHRDRGRRAASRSIGLGALSAFAGGARWTRAAVRVVAWSSVAMAMTWGIGRLVGAHVG